MAVTAVILVLIHALTMGRKDDGDIEGLLEREAERNQREARNG